MGKGKGDGRALTRATSAWAVSALLALQLAGTPLPAALA